MIACAIGMTGPPPSPCRMRIATRNSRVGAIPDRNELVVKITVQIRKNHRRPEEICPSVAGSTELTSPHYVITAPGRADDWSAHPRAAGPALAHPERSVRRAHCTRPTEAGRATLFRGGPRMPPARLVGVLALGVALLALRPVPAAAQAELQMWLNPEMGKQIPRADYRYTFYPERKVEDQDTHFAMTEQRVTLFTPLYQDSKDEWGFAAKALYQDIDTHARFPKAGGAFPSELWDISAGLSYRHKFDNDWTGGL